MKFYVLSLEDEAKAYTYDALAVLAIQTLKRYKDRALYHVSTIDSDDIPIEYRKEFYTKEHVVNSVNWHRQYCYEESYHHYLIRFRDNRHLNSFDADAFEIIYNEIAKLNYVAIVASNMIDVRK